MTIYHNNIIFIVGDDAYNKGRTKKMEYKYGLLAISGDCAYQGKGTKADCIIINDTKHNDLIRDYLIAQQQCSIYCNMYNKEYTDKEYGDALTKVNELGIKMREANIFKHKYHNRSRWMIVELCDDNLYPIEGITNKRHVNIIDDSKKTGPKKMKVYRSTVNPFKDDTFATVYKKKDLEEVREYLELAHRMWYDEWKKQGGKDEGSCTGGKGLQVWYIAPKCRTPKQRTIIPCNWVQGNISAQRSVQVALDFLKEQGIEDVSYYDGWMN